MNLTRRDALRAAAAAGSAALLSRSLLAFSQAPAASRPAGKRVLVLGGTGFIGPHIVEALTKAGHTVTLFNRGKTNPHLFPDLEKLRGDRLAGDLKTLEGRTFDAVIDDAVFIPRHVNELADVLKHSGQYLFISSLSVLAEDSRPGADESAPTGKLEDPKSEDYRRYYGPLKALCEEASEKRFPGKACVVRPGLIVGPGDTSGRFTYWPVRLARGGEVLAPGDGQDPIQVIDVRDLGAFVAVCVSKQLTGIYNTVGPAEPLLWKQFLEICKESCGKSATLTWVPASFLEEQKVRAWADLPAWLPRTMDGAALASVNCKKAIAAGLTFRPMAEICRDTLAWVNSKPEADRAKLVRAISADAEAKALAAWKAKQAEK